MRARLRALIEGIWSDDPVVGWICWIAVGALAVGALVAFVVLLIGLAAIATPWATVTIICLLVLAAAEYVHRRTR
jgi:hypothetical protein